MDDLWRRHRSSSSRKSNEPPERKEGRIEISDRGRKQQFLFQVDKENGAGSGKSFSLLFDTAVVTPKRPRQKVKIDDVIKIWAYIIDLGVGFSDCRY